MSIVTDTWRQLVRRRLWPVALILLLALVAVPVVLAKEPEPVAPVAPAPAPPVTVATADPLVALASAEDRAKRRRVLGGRKDPFAPAPAPRAAKAASARGSSTATATASETSAASPGSSGSSGGGSSSSFGPSTGGSSSLPSTPSTSTPSTPTTPSTEEAAPKERTPTYALTVRFGDATAEERETRTLARLEALPDAESPAAVYLGVEDGGKTAVFLLDAAVTADGDGTCDPTPEACETLRLKAGETEFLDVPGEDGQSVQYQLDVVKIHKKSTASAAKAKPGKTKQAAAKAAKAAKARARAARAGRSLLRAHLAEHGPLGIVFDNHAGTLRRTGVRALRDHAWR